MAKTSIQQIAESIEEWDDSMGGPVVPTDEEGVEDDDLSGFVPKGHVPDIDIEGEGEIPPDAGQPVVGDGAIEPSGGGAEAIAGASAETPIVEPGETNAAPPSPKSFEPAGVISMDAPTLIKMLEHAKQGGDPHQLASSAASMMGDPSVTHLGMDHFDQLASSAPITAEIAVDGPIDEPLAGGPGEIADGMPGETPDGMDAEIDAEGGDLDADIPAEIAPEGGVEGIEGEEVGNDPVAEAEKEGEAEGKAEGELEQEKKDDEENDDVAEGLKPIGDPILEKFQFAKRQKTNENKTDPIVPAKKGNKGKSKGSKAGKPWEDNKDDENEPSVAESVDRLTRLMSDKSKLVFKDTQSRHVAEFNANKNPEFQRVFSESVTKALSNKKWLEANGLQALGKYKKATIINTADMGQRHLLVFQ